MFAITKENNLLYNGSVGPLKNGGKPEKGHVLAKSNGGDGSDPENIFAQDGGHNNGGKWKSFEAKMTDALSKVDDDAEVHFQVQLYGKKIQKNQKIEDAYDSDASDMEEDFI